MRKPPNWEKPTLSVTHAELERWDTALSVYRSLCPMCHGLLLVMREPGTLNLRRDDYCVRCGQHVFYLDDEIGGEQLPPLG